MTDIKKSVSKWTVSFLVETRQLDPEQFKSLYEASFEATENAETERAFAEKAFNACVVYEERWNNAFGQITYRYRCAKHLWSVEGPDKEEARQQAIHYLQQYWADGEYDEILRQFNDKEGAHDKQKGA